MKTGKKAEEPPEHSGTLTGKQRNGMLQGLTTEQSLKIAAAANDFRAFAMLAEDASLPAEFRQAVKKFVMLIDLMIQSGQRTAIRPLLQQALSDEALEAIFITLLNSPPS